MRVRACKERYRGERGFTLMELVVVLAIIGILIAASIPLYMSARTKAYKGEAVSALQEIKTMEWGYYQQHNTFNGTLASVGFVPPVTSIWSYPDPTGANGISVVVSAVGRANSPVANQAVSLTMSNDGSSTFNATF